MTFLSDFTFGRFGGFEKMRLETIKKTWKSRKMN